MEHLEGEKHLVFVTERGLLPPSLKTTTTSALAASERARVVIDTLMTGGIQLSGPASPGTAPPDGAPRDGSNIPTMSFGAMTRPGRSATSPPGPAACSTVSLLVENARRHRPLVDV